MIFLSDLDNTLIFSYKKLSAENVCVERKDVKELSYMTPYGAELFLRVVKQCVFIPITTRSIEQYQRIVFPCGYVPEYAICDNGGTLLINGEPDPVWRQEFENEYKLCCKELDSCRKFLESRPEIYFEIRNVDSTFLFTKSHTPAKTIEAMEKAVPPSGTVRLNNGDKIFSIPKGISKKRAELKIRSMLGAEYTAAAGDSIFDIDMLSAADIAIVKHGEISDKVVNKIQITETDTNDPDFVLKYINRLCGTIKNFKEN